MHSHEVLTKPHKLHQRRKHWKRKDTETDMKSIRQSTDFDNEQCNRFHMRRKRTGSFINRSSRDTIPNLNTHLINKRQQQLYNYEKQQHQQQQQQQAPQASIVQQNNFDEVKYRLGLVHRQSTSDDDEDDEYNDDDELEENEDMIIIEHDENKTNQREHNKIKLSTDLFIDSKISERIDKPSTNHIASPIPTIHSHQLLSTLPNTSIRKESRNYVNCKISSVNSHIPIPTIKTTSTIENCESKDLMNNLHNKFSYKSLDKLCQSNNNLTSKSISNYSSKLEMNNIDYDKSNIDSPTSAYRKSTKSQLKSQKCYEHFCFLQSPIEQTNLFRIATIFIYCLSISTVGIILMIYYLFIWRIPIQLDK
ncbi:hypothetical protein SNEBB_001716 [Seison nebaliae]|nr:hypothetical protein SNEBB_001716 [Seison nebaliae]